MSREITDLGKESLAAFTDWCYEASEETLFKAICEVRQSVFLLARNKEQRAAVNRFIDTAIEVFERRFGEFVPF